MKKYIFLASLLLASIFSYSQIIVGNPVPKPTFELATGIQLSTLIGSIYDPGLQAKTPISQLTPIYTIMGSLNIPIKKLKENFYFGINPNLGIGYGYGTYQGTVPAFLTLKYGAGSSRESQSRFGFGVGGGGYFCGYTTIITSNYTGNYINYSSVYLTPAVMAEFSFDMGYRGVYQIRVDFTPVATQQSGNFSGTTSQFNLRFVRVF
ncbi:MAG TPA: hypothetical protein VK766_10785 [Cytophagaceae bacterium]|jgi:hypothetical protein|nr:hypothetical protein [Cytophagaceae bacterium]